MSIPTGTTNTFFVLPRAGAGLQSISRTPPTPLPIPQAHEALVRIHAVSLNYRDYAMICGIYPATLKENLVLGSDMAGEVVQVGKGVTEWKVGERVSACFDEGHMYGPAPTHRASHFPPPFIHAQSSLTIPSPSTPPSNPMTNRPSHRRPPRRRPHPIPHLPLHLPRPYSTSSHL